LKENAHYLREQPAIEQAFNISESGLHSSLCPARLAPIESLQPRRSTNGVIRNRKQIPALERRFLKPSTTTILGTSSSQKKIMKGDKNRVEGWGLRTQFARKDDQSSLKVRAAKLNNAGENNTSNNMASTVGKVTTLIRVLG